MAITVSGIFVQNFVDEFDGTNTGFDWTLTTSRIALISNAATPNFDTGASWSNTNEVTGTNWATGGILLSAAAAGGTSAAPTVTISPAGTFMWDMNDIAVSATTISGARACQFYQDALTTPIADALICLVNFGADFATNNGTFGIQFPGTGVIALDLTP
jgi:hypothetical protein